MYAKEEKINPAYISKDNANHEKQVILLMTLNEEKQWHCFAVKILSALLKGITWKSNSDFCCLNSLHPFRAKKPWFA